MTITETNQPGLPQLTNGDDNSKSNATSKSEKITTKGNEVKSGDEERVKRDFVKDLQNFHESKGTPFSRFPKISGKEVDLYKLYTEVTSRGGWLKVNQRNDWDEVLEEVGFSNFIVNAPVAIKYIYLRYLDRYEKLHFHGEEPERADDEEDENRHKRWNARLLHNVPANYNYHQHTISDSQRAQHKLSTDLYKNSEYDKLFLSLISPLPNEQDFAINVCTLMSNEGKHTLKIDRCPKLIDILLAHAGLFQHYTMRDIFTEYYSKIRKHSLQNFWSECLQERPQILELSFDDYFTSSDEKLMRAAEIFTKNLQRQQTEQYTENEDCAIEMEELSFLSLGRGLGTHEYIGQRIAQISTIIRNLSFIEDNVPVLARNRTLIRFLVMSANVRWSNLHHMGLDILGNLALELDLCDPSTDDLTRCLLSTITEGLECQDRGVIISCLEVLYKLCQKPSNEDHLHKCLDKKVYRQVCLFLCLNDIMLLLYTLECIYALSLLGERSCNAIVQVRGVVDTLVSLVTVEAQSYGADGCIMMRVVETVSGSANIPLASHHIINSSSMGSNTSSYYGSTSSSASFINTLSQDDGQKVCTSIPPLVANISPIKAIVPTQVTPSTIAVSAVSPKMVLSTPNAAAVTVNSTAAPTSIDSQISQQNTTNVSAKHAQQQVIQENEQFALAWLRATFEPAPNLNTRIEQQELYKMYITASSKLGRRGVVSPVHFPRCVRSVFGGSVGPNPVKLDQLSPDGSQFCYEGIKIRTKPLPVVHKGIVVPTLEKTQQIINHQHPENHVIVMSGNQAQLSHQVKSANSATIKPVNNANQPSVAPVSLASSAAASSSSLIKSLLANKVAQRQHMQKQKEMAQQKQTGNGALSSPLINQIPNATPIKTSVTIKAPVATNVITGPVFLEKKIPQETDHVMSNHWDPVPPLAPLSGVTNQRQVIVNTTVKIDDDSNSTGNNSIASSIASTNQNAFADDAENSLTSFEGVLVQNNQSSVCSTEDENSSKDSLNKTSQVVSANKMLADLLERKSLDPPIFGGNGGAAEKSLKRRLDSVGCDSCEELSSPPKKATTNSTNPSTEVIIIDSNEEEDEPATAAPSANAAKLFAELAASALEDEDLDEEPQQTQAEVEDVRVQTPKTVIVEKKVVTTTGDIQTGTQKQMITVPVPMQRQIIMSGTQPQMILSQTGAASLGSQTTATIKTESGYQTVPVILQPSTGGTNQLQLTKTGQLVQPVQLTAQPQTQYVLATNPQGQTYVVATPQPSHPLQTLLVTQSPQQQGTGTKTIIILQQPSASATNTGSMSGTPQKIIMTQQGQQMVVTQMQRPVQHHVIVNQLPNSTTTSITNTPTNQSSVTLNTVIANAQSPNAVVSTTVVEKKTAQQIIVSAQQQPITTVVNSIAPPTPTMNIPLKSNNIVTSGSKVVSEVENPAKSTTPPALMQVKMNPLPQNAPQNPQNNPPKSPSPQQGSKGPSPTPQATTSVPKTETPTPLPPSKIDEEIDPNWWLVCEWRGCPRKKYRSLNDVITHACNVHCPNGLDSTAEIYCQWGPGPNLCDNVPRKRFSLMTHLIDRHCNKDAMQAAAQKRLASGTQSSATHQAHPVTLIRNTGSPNSGSSAATSSGDGGSASPALSTSSSGSLTSAYPPNIAGSAAIQAIKRHHSLEFVRTRERLDDNEGPVTKSIRLTASLILRNLVNYSGSAKRMLRYYEPHLAGVALSNVESSRTIAQVLFEMNETHPV
ncbi:AT-rich interactive domain-containing protein 2 isoform X2 [Lutzomyia longipalpis]|uniref:AT-rich interactive domain-containing protein 2 isoform X2 n=1 Tax=Lutzomyia longipalpis TaxID=7200 RepID=UPI002483414D|nr:AT-rich interactive domain-containing protein 2 isoform X2 [Lutzomyia longipalpis]